jgi:hypothetical protein
MFTVPDIPPELVDRLPGTYQDYVLLFFVLKFLGECFSSMRAGGGLKRIMMSIWFGEQTPKVVLDDYKKELSNPPTDK